MPNQTTFEKSGIDYLVNAVSFVERQFAHKFSVIRCPDFMGQRRQGVEVAPDSIRHSLQMAHLLAEVSDKGWKLDIDELVDIGAPNENYYHILNANLTADILNGHHISETNYNLYKLNLLSHHGSKLVINLMGDHSSAIGSVTATLTKYPNATVVWIDAHADINTPMQSLTKNGHGMPLSIISGLADDELKKAHQSYLEHHQIDNDNDGRHLHLFDWMGQTRLNLDNLVYIGIRDLDDEEKKTLHEHNIRVLPSSSLNTWQDEHAIKGMVRELGIKGKVHISADVDVLDPTYMTSTGTPVEGGITPRTLRHIIEEINQTGSIKTLDIAEFNPMIDNMRFNEYLEYIVYDIIRPTMIYEK